MKMKTIKANSYGIIPVFKKYEETGITDCVIPESTTFEENYSFEQNGRKVNKTVNYFLGFIDNQKIETSKEFKPEILENRWVDYDEALRLITYDEAKAMLKKAVSFLTSN